MNNNQPLFNEIHTQRLRLRHLTADDAVQVAAIRSDPEVNRYIDRPPCLGLEDAKAFTQKIIDGTTNGGWYYWAICLKEDNVLQGTICLWNVDENTGKAELGYELLPAMQGKGIMSEALGKILELAFGPFGFKRIAAITHTFNLKSITLLERRGFTKISDIAGWDLHSDETLFLLDAPAK